MRWILALFTVLACGTTLAQDTVVLPRSERNEILESQKPDDPQIVEDLPGIQKEEEAPRRAPPTSYVNEFDNPALDNGNGATTNRRHEWPEP